MLTRWLNTITNIMHIWKVLIMTLALANERPTSSLNFMLPTQNKFVNVVKFLRTIMISSPFWIWHSNAIVGKFPTKCVKLWQIFCKFFWYFQMSKSSFRSLDILQNILRGGLFKHTLFNWKDKLDINRWDRWWTSWCWDCLVWFE